MALRRVERLTGLVFECEHCGFSSRHYATVADCEAQGVDIHFHVGDAILCRKVCDNQTSWEPGVIHEVRIEQRTHAVMYEIVCETMNTHLVVAQSDVKSAHCS